jgi:hypothetical protein
MKINEILRSSIFLISRWSVTISSRPLLGPNEKNVQNSIIATVAWSRAPHLPWSFHRSDNDRGISVKTKSAHTTMLMCKPTYANNTLVPIIYVKFAHAVPMRCCEITKRLLVFECICLGIIQILVSGLCSQPRVCFSEWCFHSLEGKSLHGGSRVQHGDSAQGHSIHLQLYKGAGKWMKGKSISN